MTTKKDLENRIRGWLPKEPIAAYQNKPLKPRWKKPAWIALALVAVVALSFFVYRSAQTLIYYTNPQADITSAYFEKSTNCSTAKVGDAVEIQVSVYWHGHVVPEFKRQVEIVDPYPESSFQLVSGSNTLQYSGYGGSNQFQYLLKVIGDDVAAVESIKPRL
jgi:hypothetical protein